MTPRRGITLVAVLVLLLVLGAVLGGLPWILKAEAVAARDDLAALRADLAARAVVAMSRRYLEGAPPESLASLVAQMPPPVHLAGGAIGYAELELLDSIQLEVVAQGFAGERGASLARQQLCVLFAVRQVPDSTGSRTAIRAELPAAQVECGSGP